MFFFDNKPTLITLTGTTCSGKTHLHDYLIKQSEKTGYPAAKIRAFTTRAPRPGEVDGIDYDFISRSDVGKLSGNDELIEMNEFLGNFYGVTRKNFTNAFAIGTPILIVDPNGVAAYEKICQRSGIDLIKVFVHTDFYYVEQRLQERLEKELTRNINSQLDQFILTVGQCESDIKPALNTVLAHQKRRDNVYKEEAKWLASGLATGQWDVIVPGTDVDKAIMMIEQHIKWTKQCNETPTPFQGL